MHMTRVAPRPFAVATLLLTLTLLLGACANVPKDQRLLTLQSDKQVAASTQPCSNERAVGSGPNSGPNSGQKSALTPALDGRELRVLSWNLHKGVDKGWERDLTQFALAHDLLLLQEAVLLPSLTSVLDQSGHGWLMTGAFSWGGVERGVMNASRVPAFDACTTRNFEPLFPVPKSALITRYALKGTEATLAVANLHGVNFSLGVGHLREQIEGVAAELARHQGPVVLGGDFNTWSQARHAVLVEVADRLGLTSVHLVEDGRKRVFGLPLDHLFVRGLVVLQARAPEVTSSDHNPIMVTLSLR
jgi:endonuclease/exonuclease/phosphatase (EEP) superfamily protein YafD